jgi:NADH oxidase (H2O-forming)
MSATQIAKGVYSVGVKDPHLPVFDIVMKLNHGTTYNAYLVKGEKTALIETVKVGFLDEYFANVNSLVPIETIDYLIVNHTEPDHSGGIEAVLDRAPNIKIICSAPAVPFLQNIINRPADITGVKDDHVIDLGGKTLRFYGMPFMHWPDTMMEYLAEEKVLFSNDGFAAHLSFDGVFDDEAGAALEHEFQVYWDAIMRPFTGFALRNIAKLDKLEIDMIATSHGPVLRTNPRQYIEKYKEWSRDKSAGKKQVTVFYATSYGNPKKMAEVLAAELGTHGFTTVLADAAETSADKARALIEESIAFVIGTPTFNGDAVPPVWDIVNLFWTVYRTGKKAAVFGSYGWSGEAPKLVADRLAGLKLKVFEEQYRARLIPSAEELTELKAYTGRVAAFFGGK